MSRPKLFDSEYFTVYDLSRRLGLSYARARKLILNMEKHHLVIKVPSNSADTKRFRRYKIR